MTSLERRKRYSTLLAALKLERSSFESHWQELANHILPRRTRFFEADRNRGDKRNQNIIDSEPWFAARTLQHGLHAGITSPARPWFRLTTPNPELAEQPDVKAWLHEVTDRLRTIFLRSNLYNALPTVYGDLGTFGTACMSMLEDDEDLLRCYTYPLGSYVIGLDARGVASVFMYEYSRTVRQLVEEFGFINGNPQDIDWTRFSQHVKDAHEQGRTEEQVNVVWAITPNDEYDPSALQAKYAMKWRSCHYEQGGSYTMNFPEGGGFLRESGFRRFPILAPRWEVTGEDVYGTKCPGMDCLGDVKQLQFMEKRFAKALDIAVDPSLVGPSSLRNQKVSLIAGDITYDDERDGKAGLRPIREMRLEGLQVYERKMGRTEYRINRAFFADLFLMVQQSDQLLGADRPTAREIEERHEEKMLALGPVLERLNDELLDPLTDRGFDILMAAGGVPDPPEVLHGMELKVEYLSIMAQAQKMAGALGLDRFVDRIIAMKTAEIAEAEDKVDWLQVVDDYGDMYGVNPKTLRSDEEAQSRSAARAEQAAQMAQAQTMRDSASAMQALSQTPTRGGVSTALDDTVSAAAQGAAA